MGGGRVAERTAEDSRSSSRRQAAANQSPRSQPSHQSSGRSSLAGDSTSSRDSQPRQRRTASGVAERPALSGTATSDSVALANSDITHSWEWKTNYKPVFCAICQRTMWAFAKQCSKCLLDVHEQCARQAPQCLGENSVVGEPIDEGVPAEPVGEVELSIKLISCSKLAKHHLLHQPDPFAIISLQGKKYRSHVVKKTHNPVWNSRHIVMANMAAMLDISVYDNRRLKSAGGGFLGTVTLPVSSLLEQDLVNGVTMAHRLKKRSLSDAVTGMLVFACQYTNPERDQPVAQPFVNTIKAARAACLSHPKLTLDELAKISDMQDVVGNMDFNMFGERPPDHCPNAQLRSYSVEAADSPIVSEKRYLPKIDGVTQGPGASSLVPNTPAQPTCKACSGTTVLVTWSPVEQQGNGTVTYTLARDSQSDECSTESQHNAEHCAVEYMGTAAECVAVGLSTNQWYRFCVKASNEAGSSSYGPWSEPINVEESEKANQTVAQPPTGDDNVPHCVFFMAGYCHAGANCPYSHGTGIQDDADLAIAMLAAALNQDTVAGTALAMAASLKESTAAPIDTTHMSQFKRTLHQKKVLLRENLPLAKGECHLTVLRSSLFASSYSEVMGMTVKELKRKLFVHFHGEGGLDYGGLAREWFFLLSHEVFSPRRKLFEFSSERSYLLQLAACPMEADTDKALAEGPIKPQRRFYHLIGRLIGLAIFHNHFLDVALAPTFWKLLLGRPVLLSDLEETDPAMHQSLLWMLQNPIDGVLEQTFSVDTEVGGQVVTVDLVSGGRDIAVTDANKASFVQHMVRWRATRGMEAPIAAIRYGLGEFVPRGCLTDFSVPEMELVLSGVNEVDVADWKTNTIYKGYADDDQWMKWFWQVVEEANSDMRLRMLQFITGTQRIPPEGFQALIGTGGPRLFCIQRISDTTRLPSSHACFNRLDLPAYDTYEEFKDKFYTAVMGFQGFTND